jgi:hypothetical protein
MGRPYAAVAVAIVSTRAREHFTSGPGGYFAGMLRKFENNPADLCLGRTLWKLKDQAWGKDGHAERRKQEKARHNAARTRGTLIGNFPRQPVPMLPSPEAARSSNGGFVPVGAALPQQQQASPVLPSQPRASLMPPPADRTATFGKDWRPSEELLDLQEDWIKSKLANPKNN